MIRTVMLRMARHVGLVRAAGARPRGGPCPLLSVLGQERNRFIVQGAKKGVWGIYPADFALRCEFCRDRQRNPYKNRGSSEFPLRSAAAFVLRAAASRCLHFQPLTKRPQQLRATRAQHKVSPSVLIAAKVQKR